MLHVASWRLTRCGRAVVAGGDGLMVTREVVELMLNKIRVRDDRAPIGPACKGDATRRYQSIERSGGGLEQMAFLFFFQLLELGG